MGRRKVSAFFFYRLMPEALEGIRGNQPHTSSRRFYHRGLKAGIGTEVNLIAFNLLAEFVYDADFKELFENDNLKINTNSYDLRVGILF